MDFRSRIIIAFLVCAAAFLSGSAQGDKAPAPVANFSLLDQHGRYQELRNESDRRAIIIVTTGNGCPIARAAIPKLRRWQKRLEEAGVVLWLLNANPQDDRASIAKEALEFQCPFPILKDDTQFVARELGATRTAEAICINPKDWTIFYRGAIDDQYSEGAKKPRPTVSHLQDALKQFLAGEKVSTPHTAVSGCLIHFEAEKKPLAANTYSEQIAPLLQAKCAGCHSPGNIGPFAFSSYQKVKGWSEMTREVLLTQRMPPWHADPHYGTFGNDKSLTVAEKSLFLQWIDEGSPRGDGKDPLEHTPAAADSWKLGKPDYIVQPSRAIKVPADGVVDYIYDTVALPIDRDAWVRAAVIRPDNKKVVHHVIAFLIHPGESDRSLHRFFAGYAPGTEMIPFPEGTGKFIPKGSKILFQLHYTAIGKPEEDRSELGLYLMSTPPERELEVRAIRNQDFSIPPGEKDARTFAIHSFEQDMMLYDLIPHMHLRGSWFKYEALLANGARETLLSVPKYDFNWQSTYRLSQPRLVPAGTWILCTGGFDNSTRNKANPDPAARVRDGEQSFEEMFIGFVNVAPARKANPKQASR